MARSQRFIERGARTTKERPFNLDIGIIGEFVLDKMARMGDRHDIAIGKRPIVRSDSRIAKSNGDRLGRGAAGSGNRYQRRDDERAGSEQSLQPLLHYNTLCEILDVRPRQRVAACISMR
jgi:hypothetical protein